MRASILFQAIALLTLMLTCRGSGAVTKPRAAEDWKVGTPIVTYFAGPAMTEEVARQMAEGNFNVVWCGEKDLDLLGRHRLRGMLHDGLLSPASLEDAGKRQKLDDLIGRVRGHPAMYSYYIIDEPGAASFPSLAKLVAHLRERDPAHMAYINLFPTYASNEQLGTKGDAVPAYREYLRQYLDLVKPALVSYDHYQFMKVGDTTQYFLNLGLVRRASQDAGVPFLNIVQASSWQPGVRVPNENELRYLLYTTLAYGAQGISYYVYTAAGHEGGIAAADGTPTPIYHALKVLNPQFVSVATELQPLRSFAVYHTSLREAGCEPLPANAAFRPDPPAPDNPRGLLLGYFGKDGEASHAVVVNLDYKSEVRTTVLGPGDLELFGASSSEWSAANGPRADLRLPPGGGKLLRLATRRR